MISAPHHTHPSARFAPPALPVHGSAPSVRLTPKAEAVGTASAATRKLLAIGNLKGIGPATLSQIYQSPDFLGASIESLSANSPKLQKALSEPSAWTAAQDKAAADLDQAARHGARILSATDVDYPGGLRDAKHSPFFLYVKGYVPADQSRSIAIIGTRDPTAHGEVTCERLTEVFVHHGWDIVSGLALGIDAVAHDSTIRAGGRTIAVLAHGLHTIAPRQHQRLAEQILASGGGLVSEFPFGMEPAVHQFIKRDRTQAGLSMAVAMVQSATDGGSLHAARAALQLGRHLIVPVPTAHDRQVNEPSISANMLLSGSVEKGKTELLKCTPEDLARLYVLRSRDDYPDLFVRLGSDEPETARERPRAAA